MSHPFNGAPVFFFRSEETKTGGIVLYSRQSATRKDPSNRMSTHEAIPAKFRNNVKTLDNRCSEGHSGESTQWPRFLVMLDTDLPISPEAFAAHPAYNKETKRVGVGMYVINGLTKGFCRVKISQINKKFVVDENAKPVTEELPSEELGDTFRDIKCFPWTLASKPQNKGPRVEDPEYMWTLGAGMCLRTTIWEKPMKVWCGRVCCLFLMIRPQGLRTPTPCLWTPTLWPVYIRLAHTGHFGGEPPRHVPQGRGGDPRFFARGADDERQGMEQGQRG